MPKSRRRGTKRRSRQEVERLVKEFRQSILEDREPEMSGEEGLKALAIVLAAYKSADEGGEISLALP